MITFLRSFASGGQHTRTASAAVCAALWFASLPVRACAEPGAPSGGLDHARSRFVSVAGRPDRLQHASLAFSIGLGAGLTTRSEGAALGAGIGLGITKELLDRNETGFDRADLLADVLGASLALLAVRALER